MYMKKRSILYMVASMALGVLLTITPQGAHAQSQSDTADYTFGGMRFMAGDIMRVDETMEQDLFIAGSTLQVSNVLEGDVFAAGQDITIDGTVNGDLRVAGSTVTINGTVNGNVVVAAGTIKITKDAKIAGFFNAYGASVIVDGVVEKNAHVAASELNVNGTMNGDVVAEADAVTVTKDAVLGKTLSVTGVNQPTVENDALKDKVEYTYRAVNTEEPVKPTWQELLGARFFSALYKFLSIGLIALVLLYVSPKKLTGAVEVLEQKAGNAVLLGVALLICVPVVSLVLLFTFIGIPLAVFSVGIWAAGIGLALIPTSLWLGHKMLPSQSDKTFRGLAIQYLAGSALILAVSVTPYIGWILGMLVIPFGFGAYALMMAQQKKHQ